MGQHSQWGVSTGSGTTGGGDCASVNALSATQLHGEDD